MSRKQTWGDEFANELAGMCGDDLGHDYNDLSADQQAGRRSAYDTRKANNQDCRLFEDGRWKD